MTHLQHVLGVSALPRKMQINFLNGQRPAGIFGATCSSDGFQFGDDEDSQCLVEGRTDA